MESLLSLERELSKFNTFDFVGEGLQKFTLNCLFETAEPSDACTLKPVNSVSLPQPASQTSSSQGSTHSMNTTTTTPQVPTHLAPSYQTGQTGPPYLVSHPSFASSATTTKNGPFLIFMPKEPLICHIDTSLYNSDIAILDEIKRLYGCETGFIKRHLSIFRYHHCNFDRVRRICHINKNTSTR